MSETENIITGMTQAGMKLLAMSQIGVHITFTKMKAGDGIITDENPAMLTDLINPIKELDIKQKEIIEHEDGTVTLKVISHITQNDESYYFRELGLFAIDPETKEEILYGYLNKGGNAVPIPAKSTKTVVEELASMIVSIGNATNITVNCSTELKLVEQVIGNGGYSLFDVVLKDHLLPYEESEGFGLFGDYAYKNPIEGSYWGCPDFWEQCLKERDEAQQTKITLDNQTFIAYVHNNGHIYYDIADKSIIDASYNTLGVAWYFGIDEENERVALPRNDYYFKSGSSNPSKYVAPELPPITHSHIATANTVGAHTHTRGTMNITGTFFGESTKFSPNYTGAYYRTTIKNQFGIGKADNDNVQTGFDASRAWTGSTSSAGGHSHTLTVNSANASNNIYNGNTVKTPGVNMVGYIVIGNVRPKPALVINAELNNAISALLEAEAEAIGDINSSKTDAINELNTLKEDVIEVVNASGDAKIDKINSNMDAAKEFADQAKEQAEIAEKFAKVATAGQFQTDWLDEDPESVSFIKNKPEIDWDNLVYTDTAQPLQNKTISTDDNLIEKLSVKNFADDVIDNNLIHIGNVSADTIPSTFGLLKTINNGVNSLNISGSDGIIVDKNGLLDLDVQSSNPELIVECNYTGNGEEYGLQKLIFTYSENFWKDEDGEIIELSDYDITVSGEPIEGDTISLKTIVSSDYTIKTDLAEVATTGFYNDLINKPEYKDGLIEHTELKTTVEIEVSNDDLNVTSTFSGTQEEVGEIEHTFYYSSDGNWIDEDGEPVELSDYDLSIEGKPIENDTISLTYTTVSKTSVSLDVENSPFMTYLDALVQRIQELEANINGGNADD